MATRQQLIEQDKQVMTRMMIFAEDSVSQVVPDLSTLSRQGAGSAVRTIATGTFDQFSNLATNTAVESYQKLRELGVSDAMANLMVSKGTAQAFIAQPIATDVVAAVEPIIGGTMKQFSQGSFVEAQTFLGQAIARAVGNVYRKTQAINSERDPNAVGYQRVASANACSFCLVLSLNQYTSFEEGGGYHTHCSCSSVPIFKGQASFRPAYYDEFEKQYQQGRIDANSDKAGDIFAAIRRNITKAEITPN